MEVPVYLAVTSRRVSSAATSRSWATRSTTGEAGIVLVAIVTPDEGIDRFLKRAAKVMKKQVDADAEELKKAIDEAVDD